MRLVHKFSDEKQGLRYLSYLESQDITGCVEKPDENGVVSVWVMNEDKIEEASQFLKEFLEDPENPKFNQTVPLQRKSKKERPAPVIKVRPRGASTTSSTGPVTLFILITCVVLFGWQQLSEILDPGARENPVSRSLRSDPIRQALQFDYPEVAELRDSLTAEYGVQWATSPSELPPAGKLLLVKYSQAREWKGLYTEYLRRHHAKKSRDLDIPWSKSGALFEKVREGQVWRLFTPALLHGGLFHIFFNLAWLLTVGVQMEKRLGAGRYLLFILLTAAVSNVCQYLMGGYNFLGLSGVICAMIGFIWTRQRIAAWEGYFIQRSTVIFITVFVLGLTGLQVISFFNELMTSNASAFGIANTAHIAGGLSGIACAYLPIFRWRK